MNGAGFKFTAPVPSVKLPQPKVDLPTPGVPNPNLSTPIPNSLSHTNAPSAAPIVGDMRQPIRPHSTPPMGMHMPLPGAKAPGIMATQPAPAQPAPAKPLPAEPVAVTQPAPAQPAPAKPAPAQEVAAKQPAPVEPAPAKPAPTQPVAAEQPAPAKAQTPPPAEQPQVHVQQGPAPAPAAVERLNALFTAHGLRDVDRDFKKGLKHIKEDTGLTDAQARDIAAAHLANLEKDLNAGKMDYAMALVGRNHGRSVREYFKIPTPASERFDVVIKDHASQKIDSALATITTQNKEANLRTADEFQKSSELSKGEVRNIAAERAAGFLKKANGPGEDRERANIIMKHYGLGQGKDYPELAKALQGYNERVNQNQELLKQQAYGRIREVVLDNSITPKEKIKIIDGLWSEHKLERGKIAETIAQGIRQRTERDVKSCDTLEKVEKMRDENKAIAALRYDSPTEMRKGGDVRGPDRSYFQTSQDLRLADQVLNTQVAVIKAQSLDLFGKMLLTNESPDGLRGAMKEAEKFRKAHDLDSKAAQGMAAQKVKELLASIDPKDRLDANETEAALRAGAIIKAFGLKKDKEINAQIAAIKKALPGRQADILDKILKD